MNEDKILQFDQAAYEVAHARLTCAPLDLTPRDFEQLEIVSPGLVTAAHQAQTFARQEQARLALQVKSASPAVPKKRPLTSADLDWIGDVVIDTLKKCLAPLEARNVSLEERCQSLEHRVQVLEVRPEVKYCGTFKDEIEYAPGSLVTRSGGLWLATSKTTGAPGVGASWRLVVKSGHALP